MKKIILYLLVGVLFIMSGCKTNDKQATDSEISAKLTEMQKLMA